MLCGVGIEPRPWGCEELEWCWLEWEETVLRKRCIGKRKHCCHTNYMHMAICETLSVIVHIHCKFTLLY